ncbi:ATPase [Candidatus Gottesmanbacteria bacterium RIFCSPLOWO2_01_FULL_46_9]|uniref:ATPase n=1 Tax=Candidatus Gottesmanbacteria bacterium RIFCSPLOWO2_01_FULL_46_9 TaxID=1798394 RepID=A0A1F6B2Z1_9BACT|nr:MAG: ATPase [Candidatus Gottesmanbacteria bacterium RIFCSPLOWO2_01_FULL_46_9]
MIKRKIFPKLEEHLKSDQITILIGPRQVGKTYLMDTLRKKLEAEGKKTVWLNLDNEEDKQRFSSQAVLIAYIELVVGKEKGYIFIDEIQRKEDAGIFLKGIFDMHLPHKFIVSGSGSLELKAKIPESMAGRKQLFAIDPISFEEFINFKTNYQYEEKLKDFFAVEEGKTNRFLSEYMVFGGYPRVVLAETATDKQREMQEIYRSFVDRDIHDLLHLDKTDAFTDLLKVIASQIGSLVNMVELSSTISIDQKTIKNYLFYLEQTFIIKKVTSYYRNTRKEITKAPMYYFVDVGLRNWLLGLFGLAEIPTPLSGHLFENVVFNTLKFQTELTPTQIHFWRTRDQAEVDFVLETGLEVIPVEVKYTKLIKPEIPRSFRNFITKYKPKNGYIVHLGGSLQEHIGETRISFLPYPEIISRNLV